MLLGALMAGVAVLPGLPSARSAVGGSDRVAFISGPLAYDSEWGAYFLDTDLYTSTAEGDDLRRLTDFPSRVHSPDWAPDGTRLVFVAGGDLWLIGADGSNVVQLTSGAAVDEEPVWSPDGTTIAFERNDQIHFIAPDGSGLRQLSPGLIRERPTWTPDGRFIAFSYPGRQRNIGIADLTGRTWAPLVKREGELNAADPSFARAANRLAYRIWEQRGGGGYDGDYYTSEIMTADVTGSRPSPLSPLGYSSSSAPSISPDGSCVALDEYSDMRVRIRCGLSSRHLPGAAINLAWGPSAGPQGVEQGAVDSIVVGGNGVTQWSAGGLVPGQRYEIVARGTYAYGPADAVADAECSNGAAADPIFLRKRYPKQNWLNPLDLSEDPLDLYVGGHAHDGWIVESPDDLGCSRTNTYRLPFTAESAAPISFRLSDVEPSDNYGVVLVTIRGLT